MTLTRPWPGLRSQPMKGMQNVTKQADNAVKVAAVKGSDSFEKEEASATAN